MFVPIFGDFALCSRGRFLLSFDGTFALYFDVFLIDLLPFAD